MRGRILVIHLLVLALPHTLIAQTRAVGVGCDTGHHWRARCDGEADCDRVLAAHNCSAHGICGSNDSNGSSASRISLQGSPGRAVFQSAILGGFVGALVGSFGQTADSANLAGAGAAIGTGVWLGMATFANRSSWSRTASTVNGAIAGAAVGVGAGVMADGTFKKGSPEDLATPSKVGTDALVGAGVGATVGFLFPSAGLALAPPLRRLTHPDGRVRVINRGRRIGLRISW